MQIGELRLGPNTLIALARISTVHSKSITTPWHASAPVSSEALQMETNGMLKILFC